MPNQINDARVVELSLQLSHAQVTDLVEQDEQRFHVSVMAEEGFAGFPKEIHMGDSSWRLMYDYGPHDGFGRREAYYARNKTFWSRYMESRDGADQNSGTG